MLRESSQCGYYVEKGELYGFWRVTSNETFIKGKGNSVKVKCYCGNKGVVAVRDLATGRTRSCGCLSVAKSMTALRQMHYIWLSKVSQNNCTVHGWKNWTDFKRWLLRNGFKRNAKVLRFDVTKPYSQTNCFLDSTRTIRQEQN